MYAAPIWNGTQLAEAVAAGALARVAPDLDKAGFYVMTAHGEIAAAWGDYLATDGKGDWWPVKAAIFEERYEVAP